MSRVGGRFASLSLIVLAACIAVFGGLTAAGAAVISPTPATPSAPVELTEKQTATATHYRMPDGTFRAVISRVPVRYQDRTGAWRAIDNSVVPAAALGQTTNAAGPYAITFASSGTSGSPVLIAGRDWSVGLSLDGALAAPPVASGDKATYLGVAPSTTLVYQPIADGLKETLVLASASAPTTFRFFMSTSGLSVRRELRSGGWVLEDPAGKPVLRLGTLMVCDSSSGASGAMAARRVATMTVEPACGGAYVTYTLSKAWLSDPKRTFPVYMDPTLTTYASDTWMVDPNYSQSGCSWVGCLQDGEPYDYTYVWGPWDSYAKFDTSSITGRSVTGATFSINVTGQYGNYGRWLDLYQVTSGWYGGSFDYYSQPSANYLSRQSGSGTKTFDITSSAQDWAGDPGSNNGLAMKGYDYWDVSEYGGLELNTSTAHIDVTYTDPDLTISPSAGTGGSMSPATPQTVAPGGSQGFTITPNTGYHISSVLVDGNSVGTPSSYTFTNVQANHTIAAYFAINTYAIAPGAGAGGSISPATTQTVNYGSTPSFGITPNSGYHISQVLVDGSAVSFTPNYTYYTFSPVTANHTISATFAANPVITPSAGAGGSISPTGAQTVIYGSDKLFFIVPDPGFGIADVLVDGGSVGNVASYRFTGVTANHTISATFTPLGGPTPPAQTTAAARGSKWLTELDANNDGTADNPENEGDVGRGSATIRWTPVSGATAQSIYLLDGHAYRKIASVQGTITAWTTESSPTIWPSDSTICYLQTGTTASQFGGGLPLRDDPRPLYAKTAGSAVDGVPAYFFKIVGVTGGVEAPLSDAATITIALPSRTVRANAALPETVWDAGDMAQHQASVSLQTVAGQPSNTPGTAGDARFELGATDLSIASYGPAAEVSRTYRSDVTSAGKFAKGWVFGFEQSLAAISGGMLYTDAQGTPYRFLQVAGSYRTPPGLVATLSGGGGYDWTLALPGGESTVFDWSTGRIKSESDRSGNTVTYTWAGNGSGLTITTANSEAISVSFASGKITSASWRARTFNYQIGSSAATVTCYAGTSDAYDVVYSYTSDRLSSLSIPAFGTVGGMQATWAFVYAGSGSALSDVRYPGYGTALADQADRTRHFGYGTGTASVTATGVVGGAAHTAVTTNYTINLDGSQAARSNPNAPSELWLYEYSPTHHVIREEDPLGAVARSVFDGRGNELVSVDALGYASETTYNSLDLPLSQTDPKGALTESTYDGAGNLMQQTRTLSATDTAKSTYTYDGQGRALSKTDWVSANSTVYTTFTNHACGEVATTTIHDVAMDATGANTQDISTCQTFDVYGNRVAKTDGEGHITTTDYSAAGRTSASIDPSGTITNHTYDVLGHETGTWESAGDAVTTATYQVAASSDDFEYKWNSNYNLNTHNWIGAGTGGNGPNMGGGMRFVGVGIPKGATVMSAHLALTCWDPFSHPSGTVYSHISAESTDNPPTFPAAVSQARLLNKTSAIVDWNANPLSWSRGTAHDSPDISSVIQEIVNRPGWASGNAVALFWEDWAGQTPNVTNLRLQGYSWDNSGDDPTHALAPKLVVSTRAMSGAVSSAVLPTGETYVTTTWADAAATTPADVVTSTVDPLGQVVGTARSVRGISVAHFDAGGNETASWAFGKSTSQSTQADRKSYDKAGRLTTETAAGNPDASSTVTSYDSAGRAIHVANPDGSWSASIYDACGNIETVVTPTASGTATETTTYDLGGRSTQRVSAVGATTTTTFDLLGRATGSGVEGAEAISTIYNAAGWVVRNTDAAGVVTNSTLDGCGRVTASTAGDKTTQTTYDACGRLIRQDNPEDSAVQNTYDAFGRLARETHYDALGAKVKDIEYAYDAAGRATTTTDDVTRQVRTMSYATTPGGTDTSSLTIPLGSAAASMTTAASVRPDQTEAGAAMRYASAGESLGATRSVVATDTAGRTTTATLQTSAATLTSHYRYDALGRLTHIDGMGAGESFDAYYDATGRKNRDYHNFGLGTADSHYYYAADGRLLEQTYVDNLTNVDQHYTYDGAGNVKSAELSGVSTGFDYAGGHVATATTGLTTKVFSYDGDGLGRRTSAAIGASSTTYAYDDGGHLTGIIADGSRVATFTYDAAGQRLSSDRRQGSNLRIVSTYVYEGLVLHSVSATQTGSPSATYTISYAYSADGRPYAGVYQGTGSATPVLFQIATNDRGDVIALHDAAGTNFAWYRYDAWGNPLGDPAKIGDSGLISLQLAIYISSRQPLRYAGYVWDGAGDLAGATGFYYCSQRYYDPATYQWITPDPAKSDGEESAYQYCGGDPVGRVDLSGRQTVYGPWARFMDPSELPRVVYRGYECGEASITRVYNEGRKGYDTYISAVYARFKGTPKISFVQAAGIYNLTRDRSLWQWWGYRSCAPGRIYLGAPKVTIPKGDLGALKTWVAHIYFS